MRLYDERDGERMLREDLIMQTPEKMAEIIGELDPFQKTVPVFMQPGLYCFWCGLRENAHEPEHKWCAGDTVWTFLSFTPDRGQSFLGGF